MHGRLGLFPLCYPMLPHEAQGSGSQEGLFYKDLPLVHPPSGRNGKPIPRPHRPVSTFLFESEAVLGTPDSCPLCSLIAVPPLNKRAASGQPSQPQLHISLHISSGQAASMATCPHPHPSALLSGTIISALNHQLLLGCLHLTQWIPFIKQANHSLHTR